MSNLYDDFIPHHPVRKNMYNKFYNLLKTLYKIHNYLDNDVQKIALNIEKGIFNYTLSHNQVADWNNSFKCLYMDRCVRIYSNLNPNSCVKNINLIHRLYNKEFEAQELAFFDSAKIFPEKYKENMAKYYTTLPNIDDKPKEIEDGYHRCGKCRTYKTTYYQLQTRSADEPEIGLKSTLPLIFWLY